MKPNINDTGFGYIILDDSKVEHDIVIRLSGKVKKRKKKLSKEIFGTSHKVSIAEAEHIYEDGAERLIVGSGQYGLLELSPAAVDFFKKKKCKVDIQPTPKAIERWNKAGGPAIGLFHVTC
jgi:hypothetical protein